MALPPNYLFVNPKDGRLVSRSYLQVPGGTSADPGISFIDSADSGFSCDASGVVSIISDGVQGVTVSSSAVNLSGSVSLTGPLSFPLGTAAAPSLYPGTDTNTGIYSPGVDQVAISTGGVSRVFVSGGGNVGINTTSPAYTLDVNGGIFAESGVRLGNGYSAIDVETGASGLYLSGSQGATNHVFINPSGNVGIGTASPSIPGPYASVVDIRGTTTDQNWGGAVRLASNNGTTVNSALYSNSTGLNLYNTLAGAILFGTNNAERARIDSSGRFLVGTSTARANFFNTTLTAIKQTEGANSSDSSQGRFVSQVFGTAGTAGPIQIFAKHRSNSIGDTTVVQSGDDLGVISFQGADGTEFVDGAAIKAQVDGTPGANDMPSRLVFFTTADGAASSTERMRIKSTGVINFSNAPTYADNTAALAGGLVAGDVYKTSAGDLRITV